MRKLFILAVSLLALSACGSADIGPRPPLQPSGCQLPWNGAQNPELITKKCQNLLSSRLGVNIKTFCSRSDVICE